MYRPEGIFRKTVCSQAVLIAHHYKVKVQFLTDKGQVAEYTLYEFQLLKAVDLLVGWLFNECPSRSINNSRFFMMVVALVLFVKFLAFFFLLGNGAFHQIAGAEYCSSKYGPEMNPAMRNTPIDSHNT